MRDDYMLKKMKVYQKILIAIGLLIIVISLIVMTIFSDNSSNSNNNDDSSINKLLKLLENDYLISKALYDDIEKDEASVMVDNVTYNIVIEKKLTSLSDLQNIIDNTYGADFISNIYNDLDQYNKYLEVDNNLYVNINSTCKVKDFDKKITITSNGTNEISAKNNGKEFKAIKDDKGNFKLDSSVYKCN